MRIATNSAEFHPPRLVVNMSIRFSHRVHAAVIYNLEKEMCHAFTFTRRPGLLQDISTIGKVACGLWPTWAVKVNANYQFGNMNRPNVIPRPPPTELL